MHKEHDRKSAPTHGASAHHRFFLLPLFLLLMSASAQAANYPLELVSPRAAGSSPSSGQPAISANNRIFWAYPGVEYNIRATVIGGKYPYRFALSSAPAGMTINARTGEIRWPNPTANAAPTITVTDSENTQVQSSWSITVDAGRFIFIDANNGREFDAPTPGTGTISNPFRRMRDLYSGSVYESKRDSRFANRIAYFRNGTYYMDGFVEDANGGDYAGRMPVMDGVKPVAWLAYPGESPTIDGRCTAMNPQIGSRPCNFGVHIAFYDSGNNTYIDGFRVINTARHAFRTIGSGNYQVFRRNQFLVNGPAPSGVNQSFIATAAVEPGGSYMSIQDNVFDDNEQGSCVKLYSTNRILIEDNVCRNVVGSESEGFAIKGGEMRRVTVRHNVVDNVYQKGIGGNMHTLFSGEILFNRVINSGTIAGDINQDGVAGEVFIERNTFVGRVMLRNVTSTTGPFHFRNNIIVNTDTNQANQNNIYYSNVSDPSRVQITTNLVGTPDDGIVDEIGVLTGQYLQYRGVHGAEIGDEVWPGPPTALHVQ
jgi:hypothetical protein